MRGNILGKNNQMTNSNIFLKVILLSIQTKGEIFFPIKSERVDHSQTLNIKEC